MLVDSMTAAAGVRAFVVRRVGEAILHVAPFPRVGWFNNPHELAAHFRPGSTAVVRVGFGVQQRGDFWTRAISSATHPRSSRRPRRFPCQHYFLSAVVQLTVTSSGALSLSPTIALTKNFCPCAATS